MTRLLLILGLLLPGLSHHAQAQRQLTFFGGGKSSVTNPTGLFKFANRVLFVAADSSGKRNLWITDATNGGTRLFLDRTKSLNGNAEVTHALQNDSLWFGYDQALWQMGADLRPVKRYEDPRPAFFAAFRNVANRFYLNDSYYLDPKTRKIASDSDTTILYSKRLEFLNLNPTAQAFFDGRQLIVKFLDGRQPWRVSPLANMDFGSMHLFEQDGNLYGFTSFWESGINGNYCVLKLTPNGPTVLERFRLTGSFWYTATPRGFMLVANNDVTTALPVPRYVFREGRPLLQETVNVGTFEQYKGATGPVVGEPIVLAKYKDQSRWAVVAFPDSGSVFAVKNPTLTGSNCTIAGTSPEHYFVNCLDNGDQKYLAVSRSDYSLQRLSNDFVGYAPTLQINNEWVGTGPVNDEPIPADPNAYRNRQKLQSSRERLSNLFIRENVVWNFISANKALYLTANDANQKAIWKLDSTLQLKNLYTAPASITAINPLFQLKANQLGTSVRDGNSGQITFLSIDLKTDAVKTVSVPVGYGLVAGTSDNFFLNGTKKLSVTDQGRTEFEFTNLPPNTFTSSDRIIQGNTLYITTYLPTVPGRSLTIVDLKNNIFLVPFDQGVQFVTRWADLVIVVHDFAVYAFRPEAPFQKQFLFRLDPFVRTSSDFQLFSLGNRFVLQARNQVWSSGGTCQSSELVYANFQASQYGGGISVLAADQNILLYDNSVSKLVFVQPDRREELPYDNRGTYGYDYLNDHTVLYRLYDNGTFRLQTYNFLTKQTHEIVTAEGLRYPAPLLRLSRLANGQFVVQLGEQVVYFRLLNEQPVSKLTIPLALPTQNETVRVVGSQNVILVIWKDKLVAIRNGQTTQFAQNQNFVALINPFETTHRFYVPLLTNDVLVIDKTNLSQRIIKAQPAWQGIATLMAVGGQVVASISDAANNRNLWLIDYVPGQSAYPDPTPKPAVRELAKNDCLDTEAPDRDFNLVLYPNPAHNEISALLLDETDPLPVQLNLLTTDGRLLFQQILSANSATLSTQHLASGSYLVQIRKGYRHRTVRFVKH